MTALLRCTGAATATITGVGATTATGAGVIAAGVTAGADAEHHANWSRTGPPQGGPAALWGGSVATVLPRQIFRRGDFQRRILQDHVLTSTNLPATAAA